MEVKQDLSSDHLPINTRIIMWISREQQKWKTYGTDWKKYKYAIREEYSDLSNKGTGHKTWEDFVDKLEKQRNGIWKLNINSTRNKNKTYIPVIHGQRGILIDEKQLKEANRTITEEYKIHSHHNFKPITHKEILFTIQSLHISKAPDPDRISNEGIK
ncbi:hypothetical protein PR048_005166 [Dryococelus australis]|uniref:Uncharacterized protein n=1 Tax=Dryococelus australis TaxID=614101 RepID=A0ABQ9I8K1_9NEOP|nr:hypothetical protein PR048_005166 [Dryococelus australis]